MVTNAEGSAGQRILYIHMDLTNAGDGLGHEIRQQLGRPWENSFNSHRAAQLMYQDMFEERAPEEKVRYAEESVRETAEQRFGEALAGTGNIAVYGPGRDADQILDFVRRASDAGLGLVFTGLVETRGREQLWRDQRERAAIIGRNMGIPPDTLLSREKFEQDVKGIWKVAGEMDPASPHASYPADAIGLYPVEGKAETKQPLYLAFADSATQSAVGTRGLSAQQVLDRYQGSPRPQPPPHNPDRVPKPNKRQGTQRSSTRARRPQLPRLPGQSRGATPG